MLQIKVKKRFEKRFEIRKFFVGTNRTPSLSEQSADSSEEPTCRSWPTLHSDFRPCEESVMVNFLSSPKKEVHINPTYLLQTFLPLKSLYNVWH